MSLQPADGEVGIEHVVEGVDVSVSDPAGQGVDVDGGVEALEEHVVVAQGAVGRGGDDGCAVEIA